MRADELAELLIDRAEYGRQLFDERDVDAAVGERVGHLDADVSGADDDRVAHGSLSSSALTAKLWSMVWSTCTPGRSMPSIGGRTGSAPVPITSSS